MWKHKVSEIVSLTLGEIICDAYEICTAVKGSVILTVREVVSGLLH